MQGDAIELKFECEGELEPTEIGNGLFRTAASSYSISQASIWLASRTGLQSKKYHLAQRNEVARRFHDR